MIWAFLGLVLVLAVLGLLSAKSAIMIGLAALVAPLVIIAGLFIIVFAIIAMLAFLERPKRRRRF